MCCFLFLLFSLCFIYVKCMDTANVSPPFNSTYPSFFVSITAFLSCMWFIVYYARNLYIFLDYVKQLETLGNFIFIISYLPTGLPFAIISYYIPLSLSAGFLYGYIWGFITIAIGSILSACCGFYITRKFCRAWIEERIQSSPRLTSIMAALEIHSFKITLVMRFFPLPFGLQNGLSAMTNITLEKFFVATLIGLIPENTLLIYFGHNAKTIGELASGNLTSFSAYEKILLVVAILALLLILLLGKTILNSTITTPPKKIENVDEEMATLMYPGDSSPNKTNKNGTTSSTEVISPKETEKDH